MLRHGATLLNNRPFKSEVGVWIHARPCQYQCFYQQVYTVSASKSLFMYLTSRTCCVGCVQLPHLFPWRSCVAPLRLSVRPDRFFLSCLKLPLLGMGGVSCKETGSLWQVCIEWVQVTPRVTSGVYSASKSNTKYCQGYIAQVKVTPSIMSGVYCSSKSNTKYYVRGTLRK